MSQLEAQENRILWRYDNQMLVVEPWGPNSLRVRATCQPTLAEEPWALLPRPAAEGVTIERQDDQLILRNGKAKAVLNDKGRLSFFNQRDELVLEEFWRQRSSVGIGTVEKGKDKYISALKLDARAFRPIPGGKHQLTVRFEARNDERIYGMGQYQQPCLDLKGCVLELAQRNSQASVPFMVSSLGYGLLWNNPAVGQVSFAKNLTEWRAEVTGQMDYWLTVGDSPAEITRQYGRATGTAPPMPAFATGFWQCKLRYRSQEELLSVAREYKRRNLPISVIVIDFFHWPKQGTFRFDEEYWPDPKGMVEELKGMGIELMVSVWPTIDATTDNYKEMKAQGYLVNSDRGVSLTLDFLGNTTFFDATHPGARQYVWGKVKQNYYDAGIRHFWLDEAEPEFRAYDFDNYRYHRGTVLEVGNIYPRDFAQAFYDGLQEQGEREVINLVRCSWAGSQRYGVLAWSGDVHSSFVSLRNQLAAGLNMGMAGIPWWTTDIGGFQGGHVEDPAFQELLLRWFQWGIFCPVMRLHGYREPHVAPEKAYGADGAQQCNSGAPNEVWSYGEQNLAIMTAGLQLREKLRPYIGRQMDVAHQHNDPIMRPLFFDFPQEAESWQVEDQYMFGPDILVAPILEEGVRQRRVWLPAGASWQDLHGETYPGGNWVEADAPIEAIPVFLRQGAAVIDELR
ncbi:TIM-barrel domain-containing protein [Nissabacter sp. SGAir0207]|uniref:glycoside hydrolase family 31 protein n=1 Tax=Nissabacter sp. SGAir0207 TaxID=2126321 RepID=UPI0010CD30C6|nr:glycoside hydrolase family 31 protein [Nissabacter sp. SGAir0207]QCR37265.1 family 31 glucosidase [Nissabacter sp. SGAir0207]